MQSTTPDIDESSYGSTADPVQRRRTRGNEYETEFTYTQVYMDFDPEKVFVDDAECVSTDSGVFYKYGNKAPVMVTQDGAHAHEDASQKEAQEQSFFVLSQLAEHGYVGSWGKL